ncbi:hypothetical protein [Candidatus Tisiphia endosymbiont of Nemotelus uliginosus]|uniref:hypothetical protein n=1 Tax=Candidatus Tisiphia endosymbiont of Nemotelus uliginosus TaxID=3077926 RepID=UPI0035C9148F
MKRTLSWPASTAESQDKTLKSLIAQLRQFTAVVIWQDTLQAELPKTFKEWQTKLPKEFNALQAFKALQTGEILRNLSLYSEQDLIASHKIVASCASVMADALESKPTISVMYRIYAIEEYIKACHLEQKHTLTDKVALNNYHFLNSTADQLSNQLLLWNSSEPPSREEMNTAQVLAAISLVPPTQTQACHALEKAQEFIDTYLQKVYSFAHKIAENQSNGYWNNMDETYSMTPSPTASYSTLPCDTEVEKIFTGQELTGQESPFFNESDDPC